MLFLSVISLSQTLPFRNYQKEDGLNHTYISTIFQDCHGYLWFGTADGLSRFDGIEFKNYKKEDGLSSSFILTAMEDRSGRMWIGTLRGGVSCFSSGQFKNYTTDHGLASNMVRAVAQDDSGVLWFGTVKGLSRFDGKTFKTFTTADGLGSNDITHIAVDRNGILWVATTKGVSVFRSRESIEGFTTYTTEHGLLHNTVFALLHDSRGKTWIGTKEGLNCWQKGQFAAYTMKNGLINNHISALYEDHSGNIWIGTLGGISIFSRRKFVNYTSKNGLPYNFIHGIIQDRERNTWFATSGGVSCLRSLNIKTYTEKDGLINNVVKNVLEDQKGRYWIATGNGLSCFSRGQFKNYTKQDGLIRNSINGLMEDREGKIWVSTAEGLSIFSPRTGLFTNYTTRNGLSANVLFRSIEARDGVVWIGNNKGVIRLINGKFSLPPFNLTHHVSWLLEDTRGNLWFATDSGLYRFLKKTPGLTCFTTRDGLTNDNILTLFEDSKGKIWIGTEKGLICYEYTTNGGIGTFTNYTPSKGLPFKECFSIQEDRSGHLWFATEDGLVYFDGKTFKAYNRSHGLPADTYFSLLADRSGTLWLGSSYGLTRVDPPVRTNTVPPPVYITNIKVLEKDVPLTGINRLKYNQNYIRFGFAGLCFTSPESVTYKYQLKGIDKDWMETEDRSLFYSYLPPGSYTFRVKAVNNEGIESEKPAELTFKILPPFWKTWWFYTLLVLTVLSALMAVGLWGHKRSKEKLTLKARTRQLIMSQRMELMGILAGSAVHDLKNLLSIIIGYSEIVAEKFHPGDQTGDEIYQHNENIKNTATTAVQVVKQILNFARIKHDENEAVYINGLLNEILEILKVTTPGEVKILWNPPTEEIYFHIHPIRFQQLVMNLCINAVQAMPAGGELKISLSRDREQHILLEISDTGTGMGKETLEKIFDPLFTTKEDGKGTGLGLFVVKQIVDEYRGKIDVQSQPGKGTTFSITF